MFLNKDSKMKDYDMVCCNIKTEITTKYMYIKPLCIATIVCAYIVQVFIIGQFLPIVITII